MNLLNQIIDIELQLKIQKYKPEDRSIGILLEIFKSNKQAEKNIEGV